MAGIDKTYLSDYEEYQKFLEWAKNKTYTCPNGTVIHVYDYVYNYWTKESMEVCERPVMNTPQSLDYFLIKDCPFEFVQERMREVYNEEFVNSVLNGTSEYDTFKYPEEKSKIKIVKRYYWMKHKNYLYRDQRRRKYYFFIDVYLGDYSLDYSSYIKRFLLPDELGIWTCSSCWKCRSVKALIRTIRKWNLPKGCTIIASGRYVDERIKLKTY